MKSAENGILIQSEYFIHTPSALALDTYFYPLCLGDFHYAPGYQLFRNSYDSFLLMLIKKGSCIITTASASYTACQNQIVLLDCYSPHSYRTEEGFEALWLHFDGLLARKYYNIISSSQEAMTLVELSTFSKEFLNLYHKFTARDTMKEAVISRQITVLLTALIDNSPEEVTPAAHTLPNLSQITSYINSHLTEPLSVKLLAEQASLSMFYFSKLFRKETGYAPYEYIIISRLNHARYLLSTSGLSVKEICFACGFSNESCFCATFKKHFSQTPLEFRNKQTIYPFL